jgi:hypothetical protein
MRLHRRSTAHALMRSVPIGRPEFYIRLVKVGLASTDPKFQNTLRFITSICYVRDVQQAPSTHSSRQHNPHRARRPYLLDPPLTRPEATAQRPLYQGRADTAVCRIASSPLSTRQGHIIRLRSRAAATPPRDLQQRRRAHNNNQKRPFSGPPNSYAKSFVVKQSRLHKHALPHSLYNLKCIITFIILFSCQMSNCQICFNKEYSLNE